MKIKTLRAFSIDRGEYFCYYERKEDRKEIVSEKKYLSTLLDTP